MNIKKLINSLKRSIASMEQKQKNAAGNIVKFIAIILAITLIARGSTAVALARIEVENPSRAEIIQTADGFAEVVSVGTLDFHVPQGLTILEMLAGEGQRVNVGDRLATFDVNQVQELLIRETARLEQLQLDLTILEQLESADDFMLKSAELGFQRAQEDLNIAKEQGNADVAAARQEYNDAKNQLTNAPNRSAIERARVALQRAVEDYDAIKAAGERAINQAEQLVNEKRAAYDAIDESDTAEKAQALEQLQTAINALDDVVRDVAANNRAANRIVEDARTALTEAERDYEGSLNQVSGAQSAEIERTRTAYETTKNRVRDSLLNAERRLEDARISLQRAQGDYYQDTEQAANAQLQNEINATLLRLDIQETSDTVDELTNIQNNNGIIYSNFAAIVLSTMSTGSVADSSPIVTFLDASKGFEAILSIEASKAENLTVGDECQVSPGGGTMFYTPVVTGNISAISAPDEDGNVNITISLPDGDWRQGQQAPTQIVLARDIHNLCVPLSAIRSDNSGHFVLVVEQSVSVLGVENVVKRIPVNVLASDSNMAAISAPLDLSSEVIISSNRAIQNGDRVRIVGN